MFKKGDAKNITVDNEGTYQALSLDFGGKSTFKARDNVEVILSLENEYNLNGLNKKVYGVYVDYIKDASGYKENIHKYAEKYEVSKQDSLRKAKDKIKPLVENKLSTKDELNKVKHELTIKPRLSTRLSYVNGRLIVNPWIGAEFNLSNNSTNNGNNNDNKDFVLRKIVIINYIFIRNYNVFC
ncbi:hypothetical protein [Streptobacillus notomytis]|uniref:hypothetical protein n=1 Tax=Streptobacillus notomytis TaxID=1712031 RepID=UPI000A95F83A|nr:hypothetical protein [Streptobacillus notomytis]